MFLCSSITNKFYKTSPAEFHFCDIPIRNSGNTKAKFLDFIENRHHPNMFFNENLASSFRDRYPYRSIQPFIQIDIQMLQQRPCGVKKLSLIMLYLFQDLMNINAMNLFISSFLKLLHSHEFFHFRTIRTTYAQRGNSLHCTAENSIPMPNFQVRPEHILSATSAQFFTYF